MYIGNFISVGIAWSGSNRTYLALLTGVFHFETNSSLFLFIGDLSNTLVLRPQFRSWQTTYWMLPHLSIWNDRVIITPPSRSYTANDYEALFADVGYAQAHTQYLDL